MTSKDPEIQYIYDQINEYKTTQPYNCSCIKKCDDCYEKAKVMKSKLPTALELERLIRRLTGVQYGFNSRPMKWDEPFSLATSKEQLNYSDSIYHIIFIEYGLILFMTMNMIKKIPILNSILLENNGSDKPLRLSYVDVRLKKDFKGPIMYITRLEPYSLVFGNPPDDYQMNIDRTPSGGNPINFKEKWFKFDNVGECLMHKNWYV